MNNKRKNFWFINFRSSSFNRNYWHWFCCNITNDNYSVQSIYTSGERTKANYLTNMIAEDVIGHKRCILDLHKFF